MKEKIIDLKYGKLHLIKTNKFKSISIKVFLKTYVKKDEITKRNVLTDYLTATTKKYKTKRKLSIKNQELYSPFISGSNHIVGNMFITKFNLTLLNPKYTENTMLEESLDLFHEIIFSPNVSNKKFDIKPLKIIKNYTEIDIKTVKENPKLYADIRMLENLGDGPYSYNCFGYLEDLEKINEKNLYSYYLEFLNEANVDIYVIGEYNEKELIKLIKEKLDFKTLKKPKDNTYVYHDKILRKPKEIIENENINQSKLSIGCKLKDLNAFERKYVINIYNLILGGGFNSKLMQIVREKNSCCYYINSLLNKADNILFISSGISKENYSKVIKLIKKSMNDMLKGNIEDEDLKNAKIEYKSAILECFDNMDKIIEYFYAKNLFNLDDFDKRIEEIDKVTIEDIKNISKKVHLDTIYLLKGDNDEEK